MQQQPDLAQLMKLAQSPAGQQLLRQLQQSGGSTLQNAMNDAARGDYGPAKQVLSSLLSAPETKKLLKQMEEGK